MKDLNEICKHCGCTFGSHLATPYYSDSYEKFFPMNHCPGHEGRMDWDKGPGTVFKSTGMYKEEKEEKNDHRKNPKTMEERCT